MFFHKPTDRQTVEHTGGDRRLTIFICTMVTAMCVIMALCDGILALPYWQKTAVKLICFASVPALCGIFVHGYSPFSAFAFPDRSKKAERHVISFSIIGGLLLFGLMLAAYFLLKNVIDFSGITASLESGEGVTRESFPLVAAYITICNSLLEEFFFRGTAYLALSRAAGKRFACIFSAAAFSLYHAAILDGWFSPLLFALLLAGLFIGGVIFNILADRAESLYPSWFLHMAANLGINTIGLILFGIL